MTDKQIIIDGIDVSGCVQFIQEEKDCCDLGGSCKGWINCYYKQLKRAENQIVELNKSIQAKEQECEELKELLAQDQCFQDRSHKCVKSFYIDERYKQALVKIKDIVKNSYCYDTENCKWCANEGNCINKQILQICDEVISE